MRDRSLWSTSGALVAAFSLLGLVAVPLYQLVRHGLGEAGAVDTLLAEATRVPLVNTLWTGAVVAVVATAAGAAAAFVTERMVQRSGWLRIAVLLPLLVPGYVGALGFIRAYGPSGLSDDIFGVSLPGVFGPTGIVIVLAVNASPIAYLVTAAALRSRAEPNLVRAAQVHGAGPIAALRTIVAPLLAPALLGATALVFVSAVNAFGAPAFLGSPAGFETVTTRIYQDLALSARPEAFSRALLLALLLVLVALIVVLAGERLLGGAGTATRTGGPTGTGAVRPGPARAAISLLLAIVALTTLIPLLVLILTALTKGVGLPPVPANWTGAHFAEAVGERFLGALARSLLLSAVAATIVVLLGSLVASLRGARAIRTMRTAVLLTFAVPGSTLAVAMLIAYGATLRDTLLLILLAYLAKLWGVGHRVVEGAAGTVPPDLYRAALSSGATAPTAVTTVVLPLLRPALVAGWLLVFVIAFHELTMSSLLYGPGTATLAVVILNLQQLGDVPASAALAVILTVPVLAVAIPVMALPRLSRWLFGARS
ncbi:MAG: ABC transporter permease [Actinomycetota bacterium]